MFLSLIKHIVNAIFTLCKSEYYLELTAIKPKKQRSRNIDGLDRIPFLVFGVRETTPRFMFVDWDIHDDMKYKNATRLVRSFMDGCRDNHDSAPYFKWYSTHSGAHCISYHKMTLPEINELTDIFIASGADKGFLEYQLGLNSRSCNMGTRISPKYITDNTRIPKILIDKKISLWKLLDPWHIHLINLLVVVCNIHAYIKNICFRLLY